MRNSTGSPLFPDFKSDLSRVVRSRPLAKRSEDPGYEGGPDVIKNVNYEIRINMTSGIDLSM